MNTDTPAHFRNAIMAASGYIGATEVARKAIRAMKDSLKKGIAHSRASLTESCERLEKELHECSLLHSGPVHINSNVRLFDLVRYMRKELHEAELITDEEYSWLLSVAEFASCEEGGSPSPRRLEDYDDLRKKLQEVSKERDELLLKLKEMEEESHSKALERDLNHD